MDTHTHTHTPKKKNKKKIPPSIYPPPHYTQTAHQGAAVLGLALVAMAEDLGQQMSNRTLEHLLQYGDLAVRCVVCVWCVWCVVCAMCVFHEQQIHTSYIISPPPPFSSHTSYHTHTPRRAVPLAIAILNVSNPDMAAMDMLSRLSHDADVEVAQNAILALGVVGAGTNNARLAGMCLGRVGRGGGRGGARCTWGTFVWMLQCGQTHTTLAIAQL